MNWKLDFKINSSQVKLEYENSMIFLGSCFSDEISSRLKEGLFDVVSNPFGTLFHPSVIASNLALCLNTSIETSIFQRNDLFFSWDASGTCFAYSEKELHHQLVEKRKLVFDKIQAADFLFITLGSAWEYELKSSRKTVANCHKMPADLFEKKLTSVDVMEEKWISILKELKELNPKLKVVFTVSPVRHVKDGLVENNRSKARLFELIQRLESPNLISYFPSYELVIDELRDYRFFKSDFVHPTSEAIDYVWQRFQETYFSEKTMQIYSEWKSISTAMNHRSLFDKSQAYLDFQQKQNQRNMDFFERNPDLKSRLIDGSFENDLKNQIDNGNHR